MSLSISKRSTFLILVALAILLYCLATVVMLWPLPERLGTAVQDHGDPYLQIWEMRWIQHQLVTDPANLFNANQFYPFPQTLAYSDAGVPAAIFGWPLFALTGNFILSYNVLVMASFVLAGMAMLLLVWHLSGSYSAGLIAGLAYAFVPYRFGHLSHLNLLGNGWMPLIILALILVWQRRSVWAAVALGLLLALQGLTAFHYLLVMVVAIIVYLVLTPLIHRGTLGWRPLTLSAGGVALGLALILPFLLPYQAVQDGMGFTRSLAEAESFAAHPATFLSVSLQNHLWAGLLPTAYPSPLFPGAVALLCAIPGIAAIRRYPHAAYFVVAAGVAAVLALGPTLHAGQPNAAPLPFRWLMDNVPGFSGMRDPSRFGTLVFLSVDVLAGIGLAFAGKWIAEKAPVKGRNMLLLSVPVALMICGAVLLESNAGPAGIERVKLNQKYTSVYKWLAQQPDNGAVMEFPADELMTDPVRSTTWYVLASVYHWHPVVQGYSGFVPLAHLQILERFRGPAVQLNQDNIGILQDLGVRYAVFHRERYRYWEDGSNRLKKLEEAGLVKQRGDKGDSRVVEILPAQRRPVKLELSLPSDSQVGSNLKGSITIRNENPNLALVHSGWLPLIAVRWTDLAGRVVLEQESQPYVPAVVETGVSSVPLEISVPAQPGTYRVHIDTKYLPSASLEQEAMIRK